MTYLTTTDLRTDTHVLLAALKSGKSVGLIHRSKIIGEFVPRKEVKKPFDLAAFRKDTEGLELEHLTDEQREKRYREHLEKKYGPIVSGHKHSI